MNFGLFSFVNKNVIFKTPGCFKAIFKANAQQITVYAVIFVIEPVDLFA